MTTKPAKKYYHTTPYRTMVRNMARGQGSFSPTAVHKRIEFLVKRIEADKEELVNFKALVQEQMAKRKSRIDKDEQAIQSAIDTVGVKE